MRNDSSAIVDFFDKIIENQQHILKILKNFEPDKHPSLSDDFISEHDAKIAFGRGTTWFWDQRKNKGLSSIKIGATHWYKKSDIIAHFSKTN